MRSLCKSQSKVKSKSSENRVQSIRVQSIKSLWRQRNPKTNVVEPEVRIEPVAKGAADDPSKVVERAAPNHTAESICRSIRISL